MIHGLYFAIYPDAPAAAEAWDLAWRERDRNLLGGRPSDADRLHVTMYGLGAYEALPDHILKGAKAAAEDVVFPVFDVQFDYVMSFENNGDRRALVMVGGEGVDGLREIRRQLEQAVARHLPKLRKPPPFNPHLTLLRDPRRVEEHRVEPVRWTARELVLTDSLIGRGRHIRMGARKLG